MQTQVRYSPEGMVIPFDWLQDMGNDVNVQKSGNVIIIETAKRYMARRRLRAMVERLRQAGDELAPLDETEIGTLVDEIRESHACHH